MPKPPEIPKLVPHIPVPFEELVADVLKVKLPEKPKPKPRKKQKKKASANPSLGRDIRAS